MGLAALAVTLGLAPTEAAPWKPERDEVVLERLPAGWRTAERTPAEELRRQLRGEGAPRAGSLEQAREFIRTAQRTSDARYLGYAEGLIAKTPEETEALMLRAYIAQHRHRFAEALAMIERVLEREPKHTQALLTQVSILQVQGRYAEAKGVFRSHPQLTGSLLGVSALASVSSLSGQLEQGTALLERFLQQRGAASANELAWAWTTLAEMYGRGGRNDDAERAFRAAWEADRSDIYLMTAYADFLEARQRGSEVLTMIPTDAENDGLVLRRIIALRQVGEASAVLTEQRLRAKFSTFDPGDHLRERALFELAVEQNPAAALALALENWKTQREPIDMRLALQAALGARRPAEVAGILAWMRESQIKDRTLEPMIAQLEAESAGIR